MVGFGLIPGMPTVTFLVLALVIGTVGITMLRGERKLVDAKTGRVTTVTAMEADAQARAPVAANEDTEGFSLTVPLMVDVHAGLERVFSPELLNDELVKIRRALYFDLGIVFPGIQLRYNHRLPPETYSILLAEVPVSQGRLRAGHVLVRETPENLTALSIPFETDRKFLPNLATIWASAELKDSLARAGIAFMEPTQLLSYHIAFVLKKYAADFIGIQETRALITNLEQRFPELAKELQRVLPIHKIAEILQRLASEEVSIRNLRAVGEALIEWGQKEKDSVLLTEYVRMALKRHISHKHSSGQNILPAYLLAPAVEDSVRGAIRQTSAGSYLALDPQLSKALVASIRKAVGDLSLSMQRPVLLTSMDIRRYVRKMIEQELYELPVISYQELTTEINIQPLARVEA
jgi:type III secretion protein V